jgi:hypothetical protein
MLFSHRSRGLLGAASTATTVFLALVLSGCGSSSLKAPKPDAGLDAPGAGQGADGAMATGGTTSAVGVGGATGTGGAMGTGGAIGTGGLTGQGGIGTGGATSVGGATGTGGATGKGGAGTGGATRNGGATGTGGSSTAVGGATATGGKTGGATGTGGLTGGTGGGGGTGGSTSAAMFQPLSTAFCTAAKNCCGRDSYPAVDIADCESKFFSRMDSFPLVDKGTVTVDQNALAACVAAYNTAATTCTITSVKAACKGVLTGAQAEGKPCGGSSDFGAYECKPINGSASCNKPRSGSDPTNIGVCMSIPHGKNGDECSTSCLKGDACIVDMIGVAPFPVICYEEDGVYCSMASNPPICKPFLKIHDPCTWDWSSCGSGNYCGWTSNTCEVASKLGESCMNAGCADGLWCGTNSRCVEAPFASETICKGTPSVP